MTAVNGTGLTGATIAVGSNYVEGGMSGAAIDGSRFVTYGMEHGLPVPTINHVLETRDGNRVEAVCHHPVV